MDDYIKVMESDTRTTQVDFHLPNSVSNGSKLKRSLSPSAVTDAKTKSLCVVQRGDEAESFQPSSNAISENFNPVTAVSVSSENDSHSSVFPLEMLLLTNAENGNQECADVDQCVEEKVSANSLSGPRLEARVCGTNNSSSNNNNGGSSSSSNVIHAEITEEEINEIINGLGDDIDKMLEERAEKTKLTAKNVKSILRHVITNKYVLAMVRNTMRTEGDEECELEEAVFEPKLTRSKAKELREKQAMLPWPVSTPMKQNSRLISNKLLLEEFSDDEGSSDEEYKPNDEEFHSGEEDTSSNKDNNKKTDSDTGTDFPCLVIAEPNVSENSKDDKDQADRIALRTRSKLPLTDTPLEKIEASFVAPDITVDMYDTVIDDEEWQKFLCDFKKPLDEKAIAEQPDDEGDDPEYNVMEDDEEEHDDLDATNDNSDIVTREEMSALMSEILVCANQELNEIEDDEQEQIILNEMGKNSLEQNYAVINLIPTVPHEESNSWIAPHERLQLEEQMRMHVQLLCQSFLLSHGISEFSHINDASVAYLEELKMFASQQLPFGKISSFYSYNLDEAIDIVNSFRMQQIIPQTSGASPTGVNKQSMSKSVKEVMARSRVFVYPHLLPLVGYHNDVSKKGSKSSFTRAEDNLIVLGLEQFSFLPKPIASIQSLLLSAKTEQQIKFRIKNRKSLYAPEDNPIKRYYKYKEMPQISRYVRPFDPSCVVPPCEMSLDSLPPWMAQFVTKAPLLTLAPQPSIPIPEKAVNTVQLAVVNPLDYKLPEKRKYPPILPRGYVSPLKKISPILKKYGHHRRIIPMTPLCTTAPVKPMGFVKKQGQRPIKPKVKSSRDNIASHTLSSQLMEKPSNAKSFAVVSPMIAQPVTNVQPCAASTVSLKEVQNTIPENRTDPPLLESSNEIISDMNESSKLNLSEAKNKTEKQSMVELDVSEDAEDDAVDDEQDLAALMAASSTICRKNSMIKKKNKHQRDLESSLSLLSPTLMESDPKKEEREKLFAQSYLLRVVEALRNDPSNCEKFLKLLCSYEHSNKSSLQLFAEVSEILKDYPALVDDFAGFLLPEQARDCGKYVQYSTLSKIRAFLRKLEVHFIHQPHHIQRILRTFSQLQQQADITSSSVITALQPLLRNQSHLLEEFLQLLPDGAPPECLMTDFEDVQIPNSDGENSCDSVEEITIPETKDPYGGKDCPCLCHTATTDMRMQNRNRHCAKCGTKFLDGRIYIQTGKVLKPAQVIYHSQQTTENRLAVETKVELQNLKGSQASSLHCKSPTCNSNNQCKTGISKYYPDHRLENSDLPKQAAENHSARNSDVLQNKSRNSVQEDSQQFLKTHKTVMHTASENVGTEACISPLPYDFVEDAVLLPDSRNTTESIPADFSCLSKVISSNESNFDAKSTSYSSTTQNYKPLSDAVDCKLGLPGSANSEFCPVSKDVSKTSFVQREHLNNSSGTNSAEQIWTRDQDKLILETCQKHGVNVEAFTIAATAIPVKTVQEVQNRFYELIDLVKQQLKCVNR